jgi:hypothetical protein
VSLYPNPASENTIIDFVILEGEKQVSIYDLQGRKVGDTITTEKLKHQLDLSNLQTGIYVIKMQTQKGEFVKRLSVVK